MIAYPDAVTRLLAECRTLSSEHPGLDKAAGRVLAADVVSPLSLPGFDNAAMDGYALRAPGASVAAGSGYRVAAMHAAGDGALAYPEAECCEIATGARMPEGFDTVVPLERCERDGDRVHFLADEPRGQNVRTVGGDLRAGSVALHAGRRIDAAAVMLLAALGIDGVDVVRRPRVAVIATGSELHPAGALPPGGIHDSNGPFLAASLLRWGAELVVRQRVPDVGTAFHEAIADALAAGVDLIVTTGAVSAGRFDFVPTTLSALGAHTLFHKVAMRPGKPLLAARFDAGPLVLGLPGNPMAVAVGYRFFVAPVLRALAGLPPERPQRVRVAEGVSLREGLHHFALGRFIDDIDGETRVCVMPAQAAYRIVPYTQADTWLSAADAFNGRVDAWPLDPADAR
ncbi:molybdopterin molybdotransferase MoeA [Luteibacter sp. ME-Dv--P-043b]|uniref:molybdopterin molybdotransferase MoeA n=1 Tax=Luteibacter sp. ME-Dv--P-043b TaxID=3040291 RepID=UPI0025576229|nr:molybdopterin molybdotransferase MoeA [Luteibacter sp. ME-Dv--P-043b]